MPIPDNNSAATDLDTRKFAGPLQDSADGVHEVFVQLSGKSAAQVSSESLAVGRQSADARASAEAQTQSIEQTSESVVATAQTVDPAAEQLFQVSNALPGVGLRATTEALESLAARSDVVKISALVPKTIENAGAAQLTKVLDTWQNLGVTGEGVKIGIIDTGIDYTHADFGGPGTVAAWDAAHASPASAFVPTAKVVGGYDFVGDDYNADPAAGAGYQPVPKPDDNPLDCNGHGTHVSGTAAGYGVTSSGATFTGDYANPDRRSAVRHDGRARNGTEGSALRAQGVRLRRLHERGAAGAGLGTGPEQ